MLTWSKPAQTPDDDSDSTEHSHTNEKRNEEETSSLTNWMPSAFSQLLEAGLTEEDIINAVKKVHQDAMDET